ncbi:NADP-dependent oxidoreductase [Arthrobacter crystallopoietes]|jgi:NADPH-dependent curcumin reductase|uniref:NADP-dependent oxidoreductase n=1 Tax=Crystallibacter crystallopoietes TaxID=37928 RepID=UPI003D1EF96B
MAHSATHSTTRIVLAERPEGTPTESTFRTETAELPAPAEGQLVVRNRYISLDPYMRGRMSAAKSYAKPTPIGDVLPAETVAEVVESGHPDFAAGQLVVTYGGWQSAAVVPGKMARRIADNGLPESTALGVLGMPGFTAYSGMAEIGRIQAGETLVVAAAAGPVGSAVGQLAKAAGARAVGIAGGAEKCAYLVEELGFDAAVDHRSADFADRLKAACRDGIDVYWENVGGKVLEAVLPLLNLYGRMPVCGMVAQYNATGVPEGPDRLPGFMRAVLNQSLTVRGFIQTEFRAKHWDGFQQDMARLVAEGRMKYREDVVEGLESAPKAFTGLLEGHNFGKLLIKV